MSWKWPLRIVSGCVLAAGIFGYGTFIRAGIMEANDDLLRDGAVSGKSNVEIYYDCFQQSACSAWLIDPLTSSTTKERDQRAICVMR